jgi:altronate dehydratase small subunit
MHSQKELVVMDERSDNVGILKKEAVKGQVIEIDCSIIGDDIEVKDDIPFGFKIAIRDIGAGEQIVKFGEAIGIASTAIRRGQMVHVHNVEGLRGRGDLGESSDR